MWCTTRFCFRTLFFVLYINDLPQCCEQLDPCVFVDDTNLFMNPI